MSYRTEVPSRAVGPWVRPSPAFSALVVPRRHVTEVDPLEEKLNLRAALACVGSPLELRKALEKAVSGDPRVGSNLLDEVAEPAAQSGIL